MHIETVKLSVSELTLGMQVVKLDRPWLDTPFLLQGFRIRTVEELRQLRELCAYVYVDIHHGITPPAGRGERVMLDEDGQVVEIQRKLTAHAQRVQKPVTRTDPAALPPRAVDYPVDVPFDEELPRAQQAITTTKRVLRQLVEALRDGATPSLEPLKQAATQLLESMLRNPDPALLLRALRGTEPFSFCHPVNSAILALTVGRGLGLRRPALHDLALGLLLADLGKLRLPVDLLRASRRLDRRETEMVKLHVQHSVDIATELGGLNAAALEVLAAHHERFDGSGYPRGLRGGEIPLLARIAALADAFDAITSERGYSAPVAVHEAVQELYAATVPVFQRELVEALIQGLGTHPVGCLVELVDGCVALVVGQNRARRLLPVVLLLTDAARQPLAQRRLRDLAADGGPAVRAVLAPGEHGFGAPGPDVLYA